MTTTVPQSISSVSPEVQRVLDKLNSVRGIPDGLKQKALMMVGRLNKLEQSDNYREFEAVENYVNWVCRIPFGKNSIDNLDLNNVRNVLNTHHHGLEEVKEKIVEYLSILKLRIQNLTSKELLDQTTHPPVLLFLGVQGIGKTTMVKSIADALGRKFVRVSLGGMASISDLRGASVGLPNAEPGQIIKALISSETMNPLILLDEMDKISESGSTRQDVMAALLEILDPEQNYAFTDRYIDNPIDVSNCLFIATGNNIGGISAALLDRMEIVRFTSYTDIDKEIIAKDYLLPKIRRSTGLTESQLQFSPDVWALVIRPLGFDAGIRELERTLMNVARKVAKQIVGGEGESYTITPQNFRQYIPDDFCVYA